VKRPPLVLVAAGVLLLATLGASMRKVKTGFNVTAQTESFAFQTDGTPTSRWPITGALLYRDGSAVAEPFTGAVHFEDSVRVTVERVATGPLRIRAESGRATAGAARLYDDADEFVGRTGAVLELVVDSITARAERGENIVFPFAGRAAVGRDLGFQTRMDAPLLREGRVSLTGRTVFRNRRFDAGSVNLAAGDRWYVERPLTPTTGFIVADERTAFTAVIRVTAKESFVDRSGGAGYALSTSAFETLTNDPLLRGLWGVVAFVLAAFLWLHDRRTQRS
jgi:hypothetical protein